MENKLLAANKKQTTISISYTNVRASDTQIANNTDVGNEFKKKLQFVNNLFEITSKR